MFKILGVDHIGIAVTDLAEVGKFWNDQLGLPNNGEETVADQKVTTSFNPTPNGAEIELLAATEPDSPIAKFIEKNGGRGGIQHIALRVDNLEQAIADLQEKGVKMIDTKPRKGAGGAMIAFLHPKSTHGVLLELCQRD
ncbi:MAG: methylmalonyl-CoA epimerase [Selenomonadaceae bacterium]|nr:methylmalonyl-CoA epimerase [Selenomonadaceae bacterium]